MIEKTDERELVIFLELLMPQVIQVQEDYERKLRTDGE